MLSSQTGNVTNMAQRNREILAMPNVRVFYTKKGRAKYISHLDITRCMQRALKRAGIPVWYTQGFNPHMYLTFALPLALGYESECECMDFRLAGKMDLDEIKTRLDAALPPDMKVQKVALQRAKPQDIRKAKYCVTFFCSNPQKVSEEFVKFCDRPELTVMKRTKKGSKPIDLKPEFSLESIECKSDCFQAEMFFTAGQKNINPTLLTDLFLEAVPEEKISVSVLRKQIYLDNGELFE